MERKRDLTVGVKWNSAVIFFIMWSVYCTIVGLYYLAGQHWDCKYFTAYILLRLFGLLPAAIVARLWSIGWWGTNLPEPEWIGVIFLTYAALCFAFGFATSINDSCGQRVDIEKHLVYITMTWINGISSTAPYNDVVAMQVRRDECKVLDSVGEKVMDDECDVFIVDRRTYFERSLFLGVSQMLVCLFAFTSLFKPAYGTVTTYTGIVWFIGFLACWYQGFEFWEERERIRGSGVGVAIFLFMSGCIINIYSAMVMHDMERDLVKASNELNEAKFTQPRGENVVYLHAEVEGSSHLTRSHPKAMDFAMIQFKALFAALAKEYYGKHFWWEGKR